MSEKSIKITLDDEVVEYTLEENKSLIIEVQNIANQLKINKKEKLDRLSNNFEQIQFEKPETEINEFEYKPRNHKSSIHEVLSNKTNGNYEKGTDNISVQAENSEDKEPTKNDNNIEKSENHTTLSEELKAAQSKIDDEKQDVDSYKNLVSELYKELQNDEKETNK